MKTSYKIALSLLVISAVGCSSFRAKAKDEHKEQPQTANKQSFVPPIVPMQISDPQAKVDYVADHFWDNYNFRDTLTTRNEHITEQAFASYIGILAHSTPSATRASVHKVLGAALDADSTTFATFTSLFENYLYNANSPYMNEELYIPALEFIVKCTELPDIEKIRPRILLEMAKKNRVGSTATDFTYTLKSGKSAQMHAINAENTILYFNNPDCHDCERVKEYFEGSQLFADLNKQGVLKILSIFPDPTLEIWRDATYPPMMINSYDRGEKINGQQLYDLKAIPTLYLLDKDKKVVLKDAKIELIEAFLAQKYSQQ